MANQITHVRQRGQALCNARRIFVCAFLAFFFSSIYSYSQVGATGQKIPSIKITAFNVLGKSAVDNKKIQTQNAPSDKGPAQGSTRLLTHKENSFVIQYTAVNKEKSGETVYAYKLEGYDMDWVRAGTRTFAAYARLEPGDYLFKVKSSTDTGTEASLNISISASRWHTPFAYFCYFLGALLVGFVFNVLHRNYMSNKEKEIAAVRETEQRAKEAELQVGIAKTRAKTVNEESERKSQQLEEARTFQLALLPKTIPEVPHLEIAVAMETASEVGGDYYDFQFPQDGSLVLAFGDATGHGLKAGAMVSIIKTLFVTQDFGPDENFNDFFNLCSATIKKVGVGNLFMALAMLKIDAGKCTVASAGNPPIFIYRKENRMVETNIIKGPPLGGLKKFTYRYDYLSMEPGDAILLFSDGLSELFNRNKEMFGYERIKVCLREIGEAGADEMVAHIKHGAEKWLNCKPIDDDMTFMVVKFR
ncbi:MAG: SpoIIE family protein phosphatase [bacterium]|nr:SpoIIE family protein phosphatase [bacterium]